MCSRAFAFWFSRTLFETRVSITAQVGEASWWVSYPGLESQRRVASRAAVGLHCFVPLAICARDFAAKSTRHRRTADSASALANPRWQAVNSTAQGFRGEALRTSQRSAPGFSEIGSFILTSRVVQPYLATLRPELPSIVHPSDLGGNSKSQTL